MKEGDTLKGITYPLNAENVEKCFRAALKEQGLDTTDMSVYVEILSDTEFRVALEELREPN